MTVRVHPFQVMAAAAQALGIAKVTIQTADSLPPMVDDQIAQWLTTATDIALANEPRMHWSSDSSTLVSSNGSTTRPPLRADRNRVFLSANPNAATAIGHFVGFDARLRDQLDDRTDFASLGNQALDRATAPHWMIPVFSRATSPGDSRYRSKSARAFNDAEFPTLRNLLKDVDRFYDETHIFWYLGCAEYIPLIEHLNELFPSMTWHLHLFWDFRLADEDRATMARFAALIARAQRLANVDLSIGSKSHRNLLLERFGIDIAYFPAGPSVNLSDAESRFELQAAESANPANAFFPSNHAVGKNWELGARAALLLQDCGEPTFDSLYLRVIDEQMPARHQDLVERLRACANITVLDGLLSAEELTGRIKKSGVIGLPYKPEWFRYRTSALLTEAIVQGSRIVCLDETNLAEVVRETDSGTIVPANSSVDDFASAVARERRAVHELANDRRMAWFATTSWRTVAQAALSPSSLGAGTGLDA